MQNTLKTLVIALVLTGSAFGAETPKEITVVKSPTCGCCTKWEEHLTANGYKVKSVSTAAFEQIKNEKKVPLTARSCHTGIIGKYFVEGHVPAKVIDRLLKENPKNTLGVAVPGMPVGSPGMEMGARKDPYDVLAIDAKGATSVYEKIR